MKTAIACSFSLMLFIAVSCGPVNDPGPSSLLERSTIVFTSQIPADVDADAILRASDSTEVTRIFDQYSWKSFIALNWPVDSTGTPLSSLQDKGMPQWATWKESFEVFRSDGAFPDTTWDSPRPLPLLKDHAPDPLNNSVGEVSRLLVQRAKFATILGDDVIDDDTDSPVWDQNGNMVRYEILLNKDAFADIISPDRNSYNLDGQLGYWKQLKAQGLSGERDILQWRNGFTELKLAWKILGSDDDASRFLSMDAYVIDSSTGTWVKKEVGLVGMHIAQRTQNVPQFIWATFEHVDNAPDLTAVDSTTRSYSFYDPSCSPQDCPVNQIPKEEANGVRKTQIVRTDSILETTQTTNRDVQQMTELQNTPWRFYQLVGVQYPVPIQTGRGIVNPIPGDTDNKAIRITPANLRNTVIETYLKESSCMGCHSYASIAFDFKMDGSEKKPIFNPDTLLANFSWLPQKKAHWANSQ